MSENDGKALIAAELYSGDSTFKDIGDELGVSKSFAQVLVKRGLALSLKAMGKSNPGGDSIAQMGDGPLNEPRNEEPVVIAYENSLDLTDAWEKTLLIQATPILRKVVLNSKVFLQHEYFQKHLGYDGDIGDLLVEALNFYWKEMGFTIKITHDSVV